MTKLSTSLAAGFQHPLQISQAGAGPAQASLVAGLGGGGQGGLRGGVQSAHLPCRRADIPGKYAT
jgi:hypothetical protein